METANYQERLVNKIPVVAEVHDVSSVWVDADDINESKTFELGNAPENDTDWRGASGDESCAITGFALGNSTVNFTVDTDYVVDLNDGTFTLVNGTTGGFGNTTLNSNTTYAYYEFCDEGYVGDEASGSIAKLLTLFAALALLGVVVWFAVYKTDLLRR